jgi:hypothetical protein
VDVAGGCKSKQRTGLSLRTGSKIEEWMPGTVSGCIEHVFARVAQKEK